MLSFTQKLTLKKLYKGGETDIQIDDKNLTIELPPGLQHNNTIQTAVHIEHPNGHVMQVPLQITIIQDNHNNFKTKNGALYLKWQIDENDLIYTQYIDELQKLKFPYRYRLKLLDGEKLIVNLTKNDIQPYNFKLIESKGFPILVNGQVRGYGDLYIRFI